MQNLNRIILALFIIFLSNNLAFSELNTESLNILEQNLLSNTYAYDSIDNRLNRLELFIYGNTFNEDTQSRIKRLDSLTERHYKPVRGSNESYKPKKTSSANYPKISIIEKSLFRKSYDSEDINIRLNRIESRLFRRTNTHLALSDRVDLISSAINKNNNRKRTYTHTKSTINMPASNQIISSIETQMYGQTFPSENITKRVERMEKKAFGAIQNGDIIQRINNLKLACPAQIYNNYSAMPFQYQDIQPFSFGGTTSQTTIQPQNSYSNTGLMDYLQLFLPAIFGNNHFMNTYPYTPYNNYNGYYPNSYSNFQNNNNFSSGVRIIK